MKRLTYIDYDEFISDAVEILENLETECPSIAFIAKYTEANEIIKELMNIGYDIASIELHKEKFNGYSDEYIIELDSGGIWCEKFKFKNGYLQHDSSITYIMDNCCSRVLKYCESGFVYEVYVGDGDGDEDDEECNVESTHIDIMRDNNGTPIGFTKFWTSTKDGMSSYSSYTYHNDDIGKLREIAESFGVDLD